MAFKKFFLNVAFQIIDMSEHKTGAIQRLKECELWEMWKIECFLINGNALH